jgi:hypothetical protein
MLSRSSNALEALRKDKSSKIFLLLNSCNRLILTVTSRLLVVRRYLLSIGALKSQSDCSSETFKPSSLTSLYYSSYRVQYVDTSPRYMLANHALPIKQASYRSIKNRFSPSVEAVMHFKIKIISLNQMRQNRLIN